MTQPYPVPNLNYPAVEQLRAQLRAFALWEIDRAALQLTDAVENVGLARAWTRLHQSLIDSRSSSLADLDRAREQFVTLIAETREKQVADHKTGHAFPALLDHLLGESQILRDLASGEELNEQALRRGAFTLLAQHAPITEKWVDPSEMEVSRRLLDLRDMAMGGGPYPTRPADVLPAVVGAVRDAGRALGTVRPDWVEHVERVSGLLLPIVVAGPLG